jgi:glyoxylase-like metal-dependent hydrolase (beta-lactamase superfamily II)
VQVAPNVFRYRDTVNVYLIRREREAILVDFGSGDILDRLAEYGVDRVTDVLMTHHHRDGAQGLGRAASEGIRIWVPASERRLFEAIDEHWQGRHLENYYDLREDRFSLLASVPVTGVVEDYRRRSFGGIEVFTLPTPGHTLGSVSYLIEVDGRRLAFTGDLVAAPGKVHSLAATQWTYTGIEGLGATILSGLDLADHAPDALLPAHGEPIHDPGAAIALLNDRLQRLIDLRSPEWRLEELRARPYLELSRHLLRNRTAVSNAYVLLSDDGAALMIDFGYDFTTGLPDISDRSSRRPWLETIPALKRQFGVERIEVAVPTHYHDDHVAGFNLLRDIEGTQVWAPANMTALFEEPSRFDLPCLWFDPIPVDRELPFGRPIPWREYELTFHELPGHTLYAAAIEFQVDGRKVVATGDQQDGRWVHGGTPEFLNYQYRNGFRFDDFRESAELYQRLRPDLLISGHWLPRPVTDDYLEMLVEAGTELAALHRELLPLDDVDFGAGGFGARIEPYRLDLVGGQVARVNVVVRNPFARTEQVCVRLVVPDGWAAEPTEHTIPLDAHQDTSVAFAVRVGERPVRRARIAAELTVGEARFGQQAEALVSVR